MHPLVAATTLPQSTLLGQELEACLPGLPPPSADILRASRSTRGATLHALNWDESAMLKWLMAALRPAFVLDTGLGTGAGASVVLEGARQNGGGALVVLDDPALEGQDADARAMLSAHPQQAALTMLGGPRALSLSGLLAQNSGLPPLGLAILRNWDFEEALAAFVTLKKLMVPGSSLYLPWTAMPAQAAVANYLASNHPELLRRDSEGAGTVFAQVDQDRRGARTYHPFQGETGRHDDGGEQADAPLPIREVSSALVTAVAPDGELFRFSNEEAMGSFIHSALAGKDYPALYPDVYRPELILDVGAHMGAATRYFAHTFPGARVVSFEPNPSSLELLRFNTDCLPQAEVVGAGLGDRPGTAELHMGAQSSMQASLLANPENTADTVTIEVRAVDEELESRGISAISILKIDTEGMELPILRQMASWLPATDFIYLEYHSEADRLELDRMLSSQFVLFSSVAVEVDRGNIGYVRRDVLDRLREASEQGRYCFPKVVSGNEITASEDSGR